MQSLGFKFNASAMTATINGCEIVCPAPIGNGTLR
jgi:hypothetical protein